MNDEQTTNFDTLNLKVIGIALCFVGIVAGCTLAVTGGSPPHVELRFGGVILVIACFIALPIFEGLTPDEEEE